MSPHAIATKDVKGNYRVEPNISSEVDFADLPLSLEVDRSVTVLSLFDGGEIDKVNEFTTIQSIKDYHDPQGLAGSDIRLIKRIMRPWKDAAKKKPSKIITVRIGDPAQGTLDLLDSYPGGNTVMVGTMNVDGNGGGYGAWSSRVDARVEAGTQGRGVRITQRFKGSAEAVIDNAYASMWVVYTGNGTACTLTVTKSGDDANALTTTVTGATDGSQSLSLDLTTSEFDTIQKVAAYINGQTGYSAGVHTYGANDQPSSGLDAVVATDLKDANGATHHTGTAQAGAATTITLAAGASAQNDQYLDKEVEIIGGVGAGQVRNISGYVGATKVGTVAAWTTVPTTASIYYVRTVLLSNIGLPVYLMNSKQTRVTWSREPSATAAPVASTVYISATGGTSPSSSVLADWTSALALLAAEGYGGGNLFVNTTDATIQAGVVDWVQERQNSHSEHWFVFFGSPSNSNDGEAGLLTAKQNGQALALSCADPHVVVRCQRIKALNATSVLTRYQPIDLAALTVGAYASRYPNEPITREQLDYVELEDRFEYEDREKLIEAGVCIDFKLGDDFVVDLDKTTATSTTKPSEHLLCEYGSGALMERNIKDALETAIGKWGNKFTTKQAEQVAADILTDAEDPDIGIISEGFDENDNPIPAFLPPRATYSSGTLEVGWQARIGGEIRQANVRGNVAYQSFGVAVAVPS